MTTAPELNPADEPYAFTLEHSPEEAEEFCHYCDGQGWGIVGTDWDCEDAINGPYDGETERCPCCGGSGRAEDVQFW